MASRNTMLAFGLAVVLSSLAVAGAAGGADGKPVDGPAKEADENADALGQEADGKLEPVVYVVVEAGSSASSSGTRAVANVGEIAKGREELVTALKTPAVERAFNRAARRSFGDLPLAGFETVIAEDSEEPFERASERRAFAVLRVSITSRTRKHTGSTKFGTTIFTMTAACTVHMRTGAASGATPGAARSGGTSGRSAGPSTGRSASRRSTGRSAAASGGGGWKRRISRTITVKDHSSLANECDKMVTELSKLLLQCVLPYRVRGFNPRGTPPAIIVEVRNGTPVDLAGLDLIVPVKSGTTSVGVRHAVFNGNIRPGERRNVAFDVSQFPEDARRPSSCKWQGAQIVAVMVRKETAVRRGAFGL